MSPSPGSELIELGLAARVGGLPASAEQFFIFEAMECGIEGSLLDLEGVAGDLLDSLRDGVAVNGPERNDPHDEKVEGALRKVEPVVRVLHAYDFYIYNASCRRSRYTLMGEMKRATRGRISGAAGRQRVVRHHWRDNLDLGVFYPGPALQLAVLDAKRSTGRTHGFNGKLGDRVPLRLMRENDLEIVAPEIMGAARAFLVGG
jgi:hypothetical protein